MVHLFHIFTSRKILLSESFVFVWDKVSLVILVYSNSLAYFCLCGIRFYLSFCCTAIHWHFLFMFSLLLLTFVATSTFVDCGTQTDPIETADFGKFDMHCILCSVLSTHCLIPCVFRDDDGWTCGKEESTGEEKGANEDTTASTGEETEGTGCRGG